MKRLFIVSAVVLSMVILLSPYTSQAASQAAPTTKAEKSSATPAQPQYGGILKVLFKVRSNVFGYPP
jgi:hypothetical protein